MRKITQFELDELAKACAREIVRSVPRKDADLALKVYPIPRGGVPAALAVARYAPIISGGQPRLPQISLLTI